MSMVIDCRTCVRANTSRCSGCVVTFIAGREANEAVVVDAAEFAALRRLAAAGLIPDLGHESVTAATASGGTGLADAG